MGTKIDVVEYITYYGFWFWEYQRRNSVYRQDYANFEKAARGVDSGAYRFLDIGNRKIKVDIALLEPTKEFFLKHNRMPKDPNARGSVEPGQIIEDEIGDGFKCEVDKTFDLDILALHGSSLATKATWRTFPLEPQKTLSLEISLDAPVERVLAEVKYQYFKWQEWGQHQKALQEFIDTGETQDEGVKAFADLVTMEIPHIGRKSLRSLPRAVGVWLWDYLEGKEGMDLKNAVAALGVKFEDFIEDSQYGSLTPTKRVFDITKTCIEEVKVLPMF